MLKKSETEALRDLITYTYGTVTEFQRQMKYKTFHRALRKYRDPSLLSFGDLVRVCKHAKLNVSTFLMKGVGDE